MNLSLKLHVESPVRLLLLRHISNILPFLDTLSARAVAILLFSYSYSTVIAIKNGAEFIMADW
jgi:hypothetical protein